MTLNPFNGNCPHSVSKDAKYHVKTNRGRVVIALVYNTEDGERWHATTEEHPELVDMVNSVHLQARGTPNGSFYINEYKQVIVPDGDSDRYYYAGRHERPLRFEFEGKVLCGDHINCDGQPVAISDIWSGPHPGIPYILSANSNDIYFIARPRPNVTRKVKLSDYIGGQRAKSLASEIGRTKGFAGGRFYINEFGAIFGPVSDGEEWTYLYMGRLDLHNWFPEPSI